jgi:hypothetical protein
VSTKTKTAPSSSCSSINTNINSQAWLQGPRISNAPQQDAHGKDVDYLMDPNLLEHLPELTEQTICHADGRFRSTSTSTTATATATAWNTSDAQLVQDWEFKLIYASLHDMMHASARNEYDARRSCPKRSTTLTLPRQDYECQDTKYLITAIRIRRFGSVGSHGAYSHGGRFGSNFPTIGQYQFTPWTRSAANTLEISFMCTRRFPMRLYAHHALYLGQVI